MYLDSLIYFYPRFVSSALLSCSDLNETLCFLLFLVNLMMVVRISGMMISEIMKEITKIPPPPITLDVFLASWAQVMRL